MNYYNDNSFWSYKECKYSCVKNNHTNVSLEFLNMIIVTNIFIICSVIELRKNINYLVFKVYVPVRLDKHTLLTFIKKLGYICCVCRSECFFSGNKDTLETNILKKTL